LEGITEEQLDERNVKDILEITRPSFAAQHSSLRLLMSMKTRVSSSEQYQLCFGGGFSLSFIRYFLVLFKNFLATPFYACLIHLEGDENIVTTGVAPYMAGAMW
jgi:hypothetical protein